MGKITIDEKITKAEETQQEVVEETMADRMLKEAIEKANHESQN